MIPNNSRLLLHAAMLPRPNKKGAADGWKAVKFFRKQVQTKATKDLPIPATAREGKGQSGGQFRKIKSPEKFRKLHSLSATALTARRDPEFTPASRTYIAVGAGVVPQLCIVEGARFGMRTDYLYVRMPLPFPAKCTLALHQSAQLNV